MASAPPVKAKKAVRMKRADAERWLAALRSGTYQQGTGRLCTDGSRYCCLGVLQMVLDGRVELRPDGRAKYLPSEHWLAVHGITFRGHPQEIGTPTCSNSKVPFLSTLNKWADRANDIGYTFEQIADAIEADLEYTDATP